MGDIGVKWDGGGYRRVHDRQLSQSEVAQDEAVPRIALDGRSGDKDEDSEAIVGSACT